MQSPAPNEKSLGPRFRGEERDVGELAGEVLDRRLSKDSARPIAVALSGGGDSLALLIAAHAWGKRPLIAFHVDHGLHPESAAWADACADHAKALGVEFRKLAWEGDKPTSGVEAAARAARHALIADAARAAGARVILMGHNASDVAEARAMRAAGGSVPEPRVWGPSPAWPEGRGLFLLRPLLGIRRAEIRAWLAARGETWIDDPANADPRFARVRARAVVRDQPLGSSAEDEPPAALARACQPTEDGGLAVARDVLRRAPRELAARFVGAACLCAAGTTRPPARDRLAQLLDRLLSGEDFAATLAGARIEAAAGEVRFLREAGERARGGLQPLALRAGETAVWDGRFEVTADRPMEVQALSGLASRLTRPERATLAGLSPAARRALPVVVTTAAASLAGLAARPLAYERLLAACGVLAREPA
jgi:tRNA(Ile)-lysidine synthase